MAEAMENKLDRNDPAVRLLEYQLYLLDKAYKPFNEHDARSARSRTNPDRGNSASFLSSRDKAVERDREEYLAERPKQLAEAAHVAVEAMAKMDLPSNEELFGLIGQILDHNRDFQKVPLAELQIAITALTTTPTAESASPVATVVPDQGVVDALKKLPN